jgi:hypothetical protein
MKRMKKCEFKFIVAHTMLRASELVYIIANKSDILPFSVGIQEGFIYGKVLNNAFNTAIHILRFITGYIVTLKF